MIKYFIAVAGILSSITAITFPHTPVHYYKDVVYIKKDSPFADEKIQEGKAIHFLRKANADSGAIDNTLGKWIYDPLDSTFHIRLATSAKGLTLLPDPMVPFGLQLPPRTITTGSTFNIISLRDNDLQPLGTEIINVTGGAKGYCITPHSAVLKKAIEISVGYDSTLIPEGYTKQDIRVFYFEEHAKQWIALPAGQLQEKEHLVTAALGHFGDVISGIIKVPESPQTQGYTPTTIKDIKAADPSQGIELIAPPVANNMGTAAVGFRLKLPAGRQGMQPDLRIQYNNEAGNSWLGTGWNLFIPSIGIDTRWGVPRYDGALETETYTLGGEQLAPLVHRESLKPREAEKQFHPRVEGSFNKIIRHGNNPANYWWEVTDKSGTRSFYGGTPESGVVDGAVLKDDAGNIACWALVGNRDLDNNVVHYLYEKVTDAGVTGGSVAGTQLYISTILYTGHNGADGPYKVTFVRDRQLGEARRKDIDINGRLGFKMVTADLLRKVNISFNGQPIRSYELQYREGAFYRSLLKSISELDDAGTVFYKHDFDYYDDVNSQSGYVPLGAEENWSPAGDGIRGDLSNIIGGLTDETSVLGSAKSKSSSKGMTIALGLCDYSWNKSNTIGGNFGSGSGKSEGLVTLVDINGDGLPDKVFKKDGALFYRANKGIAFHQFAEARPITGINAFNNTRTKNSSTGLEANLFIFSIARQKVRSTNTTSEYFSDFNGDGLIDLASGGQVFFNRLDANGDPQFIPTSAQTPSPVSAGAGVNPVFLAPDLAEQAEQEKDYPLQDAIRFWQAPFDGTVSIDAPLHLVDVSTPGVINPKLDGVRASIQHSGNVLWSTVIPAGDYGMKLPANVNNITVQKGQRIYFRLQSIYNGDDDIVKWDPSVIYTNVLTPSADANNRNTSLYKASNDFVLTSAQPVILQKQGVIQVDGMFSKNITSDTVRLIISKKSGAVSTVLFQQEYAASQTVNQPVVVPGLTVNAMDTLQCILYSDSHIDRTALNWSPHYQYTVFTDGTPVTNLNGTPTIEEDVVPDNSNYNDWLIKTPVIANSVQDTVVFSPLINASASASGTVCFTVKGRDGIYGKSKLQIINGNVSGASANIPVIRKANDVIFCEYHISDRALATAIQTAKAVRKKDSVYVDASGNTITVTNTDISFAGLYTTPGDTYLGSLFRGWGQFSFKGDVSNAPLDETKINLNGFSVYSNNPNNYADTSLLDQINSASATDFGPMYPVSNTKAWVGFDSSVYVSGSFISSSRLWMHDVAADSIMTIQGTAATAVDKVTTSKSTTHSLGIGFVVSANATHSSATTVDQLDMMDMNGDRYPDVLHDGDIQYTLPNGGLEQASKGNGVGGAVYGGECRSYSLGGSMPEAKATNGPASNALSAVQNAAAFIGLSVSGDISTNTDRSNTNWLDINGDGLPDKIFEDGTVALNLGYRFTAPEQWAAPGIEENESTQSTGGAGFNIVFGSFQGGFSLSKSKSNSSFTYQDINGDGLPDRISSAGGTILAELNTGNGFSAPLAWNGADAVRKNSSTGESMNAAFTITLPILPPPFCILKLCINPSRSSGKGVSRENDQVGDIDGDGYPDVLHSDNDGNLTVKRSTIGRTNMLHGVKCALGSSFTMDYERMGNTYQMPNSKWVLKNVELVDGVAGDGVDVMRSRFSYAGGYYDRDAREFNGFATVTSYQLNTAAGDAVYRTATQQFFNDNYYIRNLVANEVQQDAAGRKITETGYDYDIRTVADSVKFPALVKTEKLFYEGAPVAGITTSTLYNYDALGNMILIQETGDGSPQDMVRATVTYHNNNALYIKGVAASIAVTTVDGVKRRRETSINSQGNITQVRQYLADGSVSANDMEYDSYGNITKMTRPANYKGQRMWYKYTYDNAVQTYTTKVEDAFGYSSSSSYDYRFGTVIESISENDEPIQYRLDNKGRIASIRGPYEIASGKPYTIAFEYHPEAPVPYAITRHFDPEYNADINTINFIDGLKRSLQVKKQGALFKGKGVPDEVKMIVSGKTIFDAFGRAVENHYPYTEAMGASNTILNTTAGSLAGRTTYDVQDRVLTATLADGSVTTNTYSISNGFFSTVTKDAMNNTSEVLADVKGRKRTMNLFGGPNGTITTKFTYNALDELLRVTDVAGNVTIYTYDNLGRKLSSNQADAGLTEYKYDPAGNLLEKITAQLRKEIPNGGSIKYQYEFERLSGIDYPRQFQNKVTYAYGKPGTGARAGRLILTEDASGGKELYYGKLGEVTKEIRTMLINQSSFITYVSEWEYDTWNRIKTMTYADSEVVSYHYNRGGGLAAVDGYKLGNNYKYVSQLGYDEYEQRVFMQYGNGTTTTYSYDNLRRRLVKLRALTAKGREMMNNDYIYDRVNNIKSIENNVMAVPDKPGGYATQSFTYDKLYRLTGATGEFKGYINGAKYKLSMTYDNLYNIVHKKMEREITPYNYEYDYKYDITSPHQPKEISGVKYSYDANGNLLTYGDRQHFWDEENRLQAVIDKGILSKYTYDADGERAIKSSGGIQGVWVNGAPAGLINHDTNYTAYINPYLVCRKNAYTKHIYVEGQRIATKIGSGTFTNLSFPQATVSAGGINYISRWADLEKQRFAYYAGLGLSPGPPTDKYFYAHPYTTGIAAPILVDSTVNSIPAGWPGNTTSPANGGPPVYVNPVPANDSIRAGYGFDGGGHFYENDQYFYHPDHLGSTSYVTNREGEVSQHQEYTAFGETFFDEHINAFQSPYLFNAKEKDAETGLYYYGARYYDPRTSVWISVDPKVDKYAALSPYNYTLNNPVRYTDPGGEEPYNTVGMLNLAGQDIGKATVATGATLKEAASAGADLVPFVGSGKQVYEGIDERSFVKAGIGFIMLAGDIFTLGEGSTVIRIGKKIPVEVAEALLNKEVGNGIVKAAGEKPALRLEYENAVRNLSQHEERLLAAGYQVDKIGKTLHRVRRQVAATYKYATPEELRMWLYLRNIIKYDDVLGPSIKFLRAKGYSWEKIIEAAKSPGGKDIDFNNIVNSIKELIKADLKQRR